MPALALALAALGIPPEVAKRIGLNGGSNNGRGIGAITAAGTTQATATVVKKDANFLDVTAAGGATGVVLPTDAEIGAEYWLCNASGTAATIYAPGSQTINGTAGSTGVSLANNAMRVFLKINATRWQSWVTG